MKMIKISIQAISTRFDEVTGAMNRRGKGQHRCWALMNMDMKEVSRKKKKPVKVTEWKPEM